MTYVFVASPERLDATHARADAAAKLEERLVDGTAQGNAIRRFSTKLASVHCMAGFAERCRASSRL